MKTLARSVGVFVLLLFGASPLAADVIEACVHKTNGNVRIVAATTACHATRRASARPP